MRQWALASKGLAAMGVVAAVAGCTTARQPAKPVAAVPPPPAPVVQAPPRVAQAPAAAPSSAIVAPPTRSELAKVWHFRVALNVAALGCRGMGSNNRVAGYNAMLRDRRMTLAAAESALLDQHGGPARRGSFDTAMTRLYNFYAQPYAQQDFCGVAERIQRDERGVPSVHFARFAARALDDLNAPFNGERRTVAVAAIPAARPIAASAVSTATRTSARPASVIKRK